MRPFAVFLACFRHVSRTRTVGLIGTHFSAPLVGRRSCPADLWDAALAWGTPCQRCFTARQAPCSRFRIMQPASSTTLLPVACGRHAGADVNTRRGGSPRRTRA